MNARLQQRLERLEAAVLGRTRQVEADAARAERHRALQVLVADVEAMDRYHHFLTAISRVQCHHQTCGACWPCQRVDQAVQEAWEAYQMRMAILKHDQDGGGQAISSSLTHTPEGGST